MDSNSLMLPLVRAGIRLSGVPRRSAAISACKRTLIGTWLRARSRAVGSGRVLVAGGGDRDGLPRTQTLGSVDHNVHARRNATVEDRDLTFRESHLYWLHLRHLAAIAVIVDDPNELRAIQACLYSGSGNNHGILPLFDNQVNVDELIGEED